MQLSRFYLGTICSLIPPILKLNKNLLLGLIVIFILSVLLIPLSLISSSKVLAEKDKVEKKIEYNEDYVDELISIYATQYKVSPVVIKSILDCETGGSYTDPTIQSRYTYKSDHPEWGVEAGDRELSYGYSQIHLPSWTDITYKQATDPEFAIDFLAKRLSEGKGSYWSCY